mmetsp:Transcript_38375/g.49623  ORF Transcript_38375/g.49623 Transcript_38375/m.49623 type:complete len:86 (+) Transcript_38375:151-408(+)
MTVELIERIADLEHALDVFFVLWGACQVFFMQFGFSMLEIGCVQPSCTINVLMKNIFDVTVSVVTWGFVGGKFNYPVDIFYNVYQ